MGDHTPSADELQIVWMNHRANMKIPKIPIEYEMNEIFECVMPESRILQSTNPYDTYAKCKRNYSTFR